MKAITLWQPYASCIAAGLKTIETRSWPAPKALIGQRIAIHAAKRYPVPFQDDRIGDFTFTEDIPLGAVVATAQLAECYPMIEANDEIPMVGGFVYVDTNFIQVHESDDDSAPCYIEDELNYGDFASGRWAWLLVNVEALPEPIPATGHQGLWNWSTE